MNTQAILQLADFIAAERELPFDMNDTRIPRPDVEIEQTRFCGTPGCIAGFACVLWPEIIMKDETLLPHLPWDTKAFKNQLGITLNVYNALCYPGWNNETYADEVDDNHIAYDNLTRAGAVATLRRLAQTGAVEWRLGEQKTDHE